MSNSKKTHDGRGIVNMTQVPKDVMEKGRGAVAMTPVPNLVPEERGRGPVAITPIPSSGQQQTTAPPAPTTGGSTQDSPAPSGQGDSK